MTKPNFEDLINPPPQRWPTRGDRLLTASANWTSGVRFPNDEWLRHIYIMDGFMMAGDKLIEAAEDRIERETLLFAVLYNYRHAVELGLKWLLVQYGSLADITLDDVEEAKHDLWRLWRLCRRLIELGATEGDQPGIAAVELVVKDLHDLDPSAMALRYWHDKNREAFRLPDGRYDLDRTRDVMKGIANFFSGVDGQLSALADAQP